MNSIDRLEIDLVFLFFCERAEPKTLEVSEVLKLETVQRASHVRFVALQRDVRVQFVALLRDVHVQNVKF